MIRRPPRSTLSSSSAASDVYKRQPPETSRSRSWETDASSDHEWCSETICATAQLGSATQAAAPVFGHRSAERGGRGAVPPQMMLEISQDEVATWEEVLPSEHTLTAYPHEDATINDLHDFEASMFDDTSRGPPRRVDHTSVRRGAEGSEKQFGIVTPDGEAMLLSEKEMLCHLHNMLSSMDRKLNPPASPEAPVKLSLIHISEPTRLLSISYAVFCLKKKKTLHQPRSNHHQRTLPCIPHTISHRSHQH
eukprot:TRINITY_DN46148_c0_g1_i1.p1 TRINITY_DN46148_c0_g1~~TRINITY_DN46148_c0_g1_i1.p1  ORF type:complete len:250 (-),score=56.26 TRINITY_DN46148_c0_g1_i1:25-774(-)